MGFDRDVVDNLPTQNTVLLNDERLTRYADIEENPLNDDAESITL